MPQILKDIDRFLHWFVPISAYLARGVVFIVNSYQINDFISVDGLQQVHSQNKLKLEVFDIICL